MTINYVSIKSVLNQLALTIDDRYWNEAVMLEQATHGLRQMNISLKLEPKLKVLELCNHKVQLPTDLKYLVQVAYKLDVNSDTVTAVADLDLPPTSTLEQQLVHPSKFGYAAMRLTTNPFHDSICLDDRIFACRDCLHEFSVSTSMVLTSTKQNGIILVAYLGYPKDENNVAMIPDDENLKEAIFHYVLYRYWLSKYSMKEDGAEQRMKFHLQMWSTLARKAQSLNNPDVNQLENIKNQWTRLIPRTNQFDKLFLSLSSKENVNF